MVMSKAYHKFLQRLAYFKDDLELTDVLCSSIVSGALSSPQSRHILDKVVPTEHKHLARRTNSDGSRKLVSTHLSKTVYSAYIKDIYEEVTDYLKTILLCAACKGIDPGRIVGEHKITKTAQEILSAGSWDSILEMVTDSIFQALESERSTLSLIKKISTKLALDVDQSKIDNALPFLEIRHFLVHSDGKLNQKFRTHNPMIPCDLKGYVKLDLNLVQQFTDNVKNLLTEYDKQVCSKRILLDKHIHRKPK